MEIAHIGLGGNIGDVEKNILEAVRKISLIPATRILKISSLYKTEPVGFESQPYFINAALEIETAQSPLELLNALHEIEAGMGRTRSVKWGPRTVDLDILLFGEKIIKSSAVNAPHPRMHERAFVLVPLAEIAPEAVHPVLSKTVNRLLSELPAAQGVELWKKPVWTDIDKVALEL